MNFVSFSTTEISTRHLAKGEIQICQIIRSGSESVIIGGDFFYVIVLTSP